MIYSIGHGNRSWNDFINIINQYNGKYLVDVRSFPKSKYNPQFDRYTIDKECKKSGIKYIFMGNSLGGRPENRELYDQKGRADYALMSKDIEYIASIERLQRASQLSGNTFIMCSELCPSQCHRSKLIGKTLDDSGVQPIHIDKYGREMSQESVLRMITNGQQDLFGGDASISKSRGTYMR